MPFVSIAAVLVVAASLLFSVAWNVAALALPGRILGPLAFDPAARLAFVLLTATLYRAAR